MAKSKPLKKKKPIKTGIAKRDAFSTWEYTFKKNGKVDKKQEHFKGPVNEKEVYKR